MPDRSRNLELQVEGCWPWLGIQPSSFYGVCPEFSQENGAMHKALSNSNSSTMDHQHQQISATKSHHCNNTTTQAHVKQANPKLEMATTQQAKTLLLKYVNARCTCLRCLHEWDTHNMDKNIKNNTTRIPLCKTLLTSDHGTQSKRRVTSYPFPFIISFLNPRGSSMRMCSSG